MKFILVVIYILLAANIANALSICKMADLMKHDKIEYIAKKQQLLSAEVLSIYNLRESSSR